MSTYKEFYEDPSDELAGLFLATSPVPKSEMPSLSIQRLNGLFEDVAQTAVKRAVEALPYCVRTWGYIEDWTKTNHFWDNVYHGVKFTDDIGNYIKVNLPVFVIEGNHLQPNCLTDVIGTFVINVKNSKVYLNLYIHAASTVDPSVAANRQMKDQNIASALCCQLKDLGFKRQAFPKHVKSISVIHSKSSDANVFEDFKRAFELNSVPVQSMPVSMKDPLDIANAVDTADGDVVVLIRGGGNEEDFQPFQEDLIVKALIQKSAYRVTGIGHSGNLTFTDIVADFCATTPSSAGTYVREQVVRTFSMKQNQIKELEATCAEQRLQIERMKSTNSKVFELEEDITKLREKFEKLKNECSIS